MNKSFLVRNAVNNISPARRDPYLRLALAVCRQAVDDLKSKDPIIFLDAYSWLIENAEHILPAAGIDIDPDSIVSAVIKGAYG